MVSYQHQLKKDQSNVLRKDFNGAVRRDGSYSTFKYLRVSLVYHVQNHKGEGSCSFLVTFQTQSNTPPFGTHFELKILEGRNSLGRLLSRLLRPGRVQYTDLFVNSTRVPWPNKQNIYLFFFSLHFVHWLIFIQSMPDRNSAILPF